MLMVALRNTIKTHLVVRGFSQVPNIDYMDTFSPVVKIDSIRIIFALTIQYDKEVHQLYVKTTFLNGILEEENYLKFLGFKKSKDSNLVVRLHKSLYGLL
jgi:folate-dependent tRNA-U54 methylase TrmFO/GidA